MNQTLLRGKFKDGVLRAQHLPPIDGCVIDGCPPRLPLSEADMQVDLDRRRPGQSRITSSRKEADTCKIASGIADGLTTGSPIKVEVPNTDQRGDDYSEMLLAYRPSHADATYDFKYGVRSVQGGGRSSARETIGRVAAGAVAKKILKQYSGTKIIAYVSQVDKLVLPEDLIDHETMTPDQGGISNGEIINMRIAFKPTPTISRKQNTVTRYKRETEIIARGRRDPCVVPQGVPVVEAMVALVLVDQLMAQYAQCMLFPINPALQEPLQLSKDKELQVKF